MKKFKITPELIANIASIGGLVASALGSLVAKQVATNERARLASEIEANVLKKLSEKK